MSKHKNISNKNKVGNFSASKIGALENSQSEFSLYPPGTALDTGHDLKDLTTLHPICPQSPREFQPLCDYLVYEITHLVVKNLKAMNRPMDLAYWKEITRRILSAEKPGIQVIPAQAGYGKSTWITAFLQAMCQFYQSRHREAESLGGILVIVQKVETLNEMHQALGDKAAELMVPLQSLTASGKSFGLCPNPLVTDHNRCNPTSCPYVAECPLKALESRSRQAYILGATQARFYGLRQNGLLGQLLQRESLTGDIVPRRYILMDEKPALHEIHALSTETVNQLSSHFEWLAAQKRLSDQSACSIQSSLGIHINKPLQELRRETVIRHSGYKPVDELVGLCTFRPDHAQQKAYQKFRNSLEKRPDLMSRELQSCFTVTDRLYNQDPCIFCKVGNFHVATVRDGMRDLQGRQILIFDATAPVDADYLQQPNLEFLPDPPPRNTSKVMFHIYSSSALNVSETAMRKAGMIDGLCALIEEILVQHPAETYLCTYQKYSTAFPQKLSAQALQYIPLMPNRTPPCTPYFGGNNGSNRFRQCRNVILLGYPRLDPSTYFERSYAVWQDVGFRADLQRIAESMRHQEFPWQNGLRCLPLVMEYESRHLAARLEQEIYRSILRNFHVSDSVHVFLLAPPEGVWKWLHSRFPGCSVDMVTDTPACILCHRESYRTYKGQKTAFTLLADFLSSWDGAPILTSELRKRLEISPAAWKELLRSERFSKLLESQYAAMTGYGRGATFIRLSDTNVPFSA